MLTDSTRVHNGVHDMGLKRKVSFLDPPTPAESASTTPTCGGTSCCTHPDCVPLKEHALCQRWFFLRWAPVTATMGSEILQELRQRMEQRNFRCCGAVTPTGIYEILVRVEPSELPLWAGNLLPDPLSTLFHAGDCAAWHLQCCWDALEVDAEIWQKSMRDGEGRITFGDVGLVHDMVADVRAAGIPDGEI